MYRDCYHLRKHPFAMSPDPALLYMTEQHREALAGLLYAVLECKGLAVLTGEAGTGKTTLLRRVLKELPGDRIPSSIIFNPSLTPDELLEMTLMGFGLKEVAATKPQRLRQLQEFLMHAHSAGRAPLLAIDEAHVLNGRLLEEVRLLSNFELSDKKLLQIVLIGQGELTELLDEDHLRQLKQRIAVRLSIRPLGASEIAGYLEFRWAGCGGSLPVPFHQDAIEAVAAWSNGIPRLINSLCDNALMAAFGRGAPIVETAHVEEAATDLRLRRPRSTPRPATIEEPMPVPVLQVGHVQPLAEMPPVRIFSAEINPGEAGRSGLWRWVSRLGVSGD